MVHHWSCEAFLMFLCLTFMYDSYESIVTGSVWPSHGGYCDSSQMQKLRPREVI